MKLKEYLSTVWISIKQSVMSLWGGGAVIVVIVFGIVYVFLRLLVHDWSGAVEFNNYGGPLGY